MKICLVGAELFHVDGWKDRNEQVNSHFSQFCEHAQKMQHNKNISEL